MVGIFYGVAAFLCWGLMPLYWRELKSVPAPELLAHRVVWSLIFLSGMLALRGRLREVPGVFRSGRLFLTLLLSSTLIGANWLLFIWAVNNGHVLESSLGYFINPLMNVALGALVLKEKLTRPRQIAVALAGSGVILYASQGSGLPWIALGLAVSFALYGLLRKTAAADALLGLSVETLILTPLAVAFLAYLEVGRGGTFGQTTIRTDVLLILAGIVTALPLLWFAHAARRLDLSTVGLLQYLAPTGQFLLAVFVYNEPFSALSLVSFALIWGGLAFYSGSAWRSYRKSHLA